MAIYYIRDGEGFYKESVIIRDPMAPIPPHNTEVPPMEAEEGMAPFWNGDAWVLRERIITVEDPEAPPETSDVVRTPVEDTPPEAE